MKNFSIKELDIKNKLSKSKFTFIILVVTIIACIPLFRENLDVYYDDGIQHIARAYETYLSIENGENPTILSSLTNGFGYSWDLFYGPLSTIMILFCKLLTSNFINAYKLVLFVGLFLSRFYYV